LLFIKPDFKIIKIIKHTLYYYDDNNTSGCIIHGNNNKRPRYRTRLF